MNRIRARLKAMRGRIVPETVLRETSCLIPVCVVALSLAR